jgi:hypothetical protein
MHKNQSKNLAKTETIASRKSILLKNVLGSDLQSEWKQNYI